MTTSSERGKWVNAMCWGSCGGRCVNKIYVVDGKPVRQMTDETHNDGPDYPQQRACARGRAYRQMVMGENRVKYPVKRKHWSPGGGARQLRGEDTWERISWEESLDLVAAELRRVRQFGNQSIVAWGAEIGRMLSLTGGYVLPWGSTSWGTWLETGPRIGHDANPWLINDRFDLRNSDLIVLWGSNPAWTSGGNPTYHFLQAKRAGAKFISIDPLYTETAKVLGAEWIPARPATDHALALGIAHSLLMLDAEGEDLIDWDFLKRCTIGFDDGDPHQNLRDYILGMADGEAKSASWASGISGVPPERIRELARDIGRNKKVALLTGWAPARVNNADSWPQMFMALGAMTGHLGLSGHMTGLSTYSRAADGGPPLVRPGGTGVSPVQNPLEHIRLNHNEVWEAVLTGHHTAAGGVRSPIDIRAIYHSTKGRLNQLGGTMKAIRAHRAVEFVVAQDYAWSPQCQYADIVLPVTTPWERTGMMISGNREMVILSERVIDPLYEARDDLWIARELGERLGIAASRVEPLSPAQQVYNQVSGATVVKEDGTGYEKLVTITPEDIQQWGVTGTPQKGRISLRELRDQGVYQVPRSPGDKHTFIAYREFRQDPEKHPLPTKSGKLEIRCDSIALFVRSCGFSEISPVPQYSRPVEGYEDTFRQWPEDEKQQFPLQLITSHARGRTNSILNGVPWLIEAFPQRLIMSVQDAAERGISDGDTVSVRSRHGRTVCPVSVTARLIPGVVILPEGIWIEIKGDADYAGSANVLVGDIATGQGHTGWNSCNVQVEKHSNAATAQGAGTNRGNGGVTSGALRAGKEAFSFDSELCTGCRACQIACKDKNDLSAGETFRLVSEVESGEFPNPVMHHRNESCLHCEDPACLSACPAGAITKSGKYGAVLIDQGKCQGCGLCVEACGHGHIVLRSSTGKASKCDLCIDRIAQGGEPACVAACNMRALHFARVV